MPLWEREHDRFTPTRVGNTQVVVELTEANAVHPHACGEYWGKGRATWLAWRFTPTRVGNTALPSTYDQKTTVHPHACGEYSCDATTHIHIGGSPPRVWGILIQYMVGHGRMSVHPHACGEYLGVVKLRDNCIGSPPRVWGIRRPPICWRDSARFTPTRVGNTLSVPDGNTDRAVHPHACGEYSPRVCIAIHSTGSPPRVWGILVDVAFLCHYPRFTPTRVGNTKNTREPSGMWAVHPHACGEYVMTPLWHLAYQRFTPTRVGNTR